MFTFNLWVHSTKVINEKILPKNNVFYPFFKTLLFLTHFSWKQSNHRKRSPNTHTGKNSFGPLLIGNYRAKPEKHYHKVFFPKKETCDVSLDPRPKKKSSACQEKNQDLGGKRSFTQSCFYRVVCRLLPEQTTNRRENWRSVLCNLIITFLSNNIN